MRVEFIDTKSISKAADYAVDKYQPKLSWFSTVNYIGSSIWGSLITLGLVLVLTRIPYVFRNQPGFIVGLCAILLGLCVLFLQKYYSKKTITKNDRIDLKISYEIVDNKVISRIGEKIKVEIMPSAIIDIVQKLGYILIFIGKRRALYIPINAFDSNSEKDTFFAALKNIWENSC